MASRGYAVLYPDVPVRTGHTTEDLVAAVLPAVDAVVDAGFADPQRLAIMGQSYGSINVLAVLTRTDRFRAAIISAAVLHPDLFADYLRDNTGYYETGQGDMGGTIWELPERYRANSPLFEFDRIDTPLLIGQGELDGDLVPSEAIFNALERLGKHVEYRVYAGESHVITQPANVIDFWERRLEFLAEHLRLDVDEKGRVSPARR
jgi:dipeptidyl aminopeptidase/acylaminoacyl peptidase